MGAYLTRLLGFSSIPCPSDWAFIAYAVHVIHESGVINQQYRDNFAEVEANL